MGPPASGKSVVAELLCKKFKLHHITIKDVIDETIQKLEQSAGRLDHVGVSKFKSNGELKIRFLQLVGILTDEQKTLLFGPISLSKSV